VAVDLVDAYLDGFQRGDVDAVLGLLAPDSVFQSPFGTWRGRFLRSVYAARAVVFEDLDIDAPIRGGGRAVILWRAAVAGARVEATEVLSLGETAIDRVDAYLRPAGVLESVYTAMTRAWPARPDPRRSVTGAQDPRPIPAPSGPASPAGRSAPGPVR
jgi:hypothetical protein